MNQPESAVIWATVENSNHPEYGVAMIPFPIPRESYDNYTEKLRAMGIGAPSKQDCRVVSVLSSYSVLKPLEIMTVNMDELDYLAKRLDSFDEGEATQFQAMAHKMELFELKDLINLTFCCQQATVITDFSDLEQVGRDHYMNLHGGCASTYELDELNGAETALKLLDSGKGVITPYGVVFDNGMKLEQHYDGIRFPAYHYEQDVLTVGLTAWSDPNKDQNITWVCLPASKMQIERAIARSGIEPQDMRLIFGDSQLPNEVDVAMDFRRENLDDLNALALAVEKFTEGELCKLGAVVTMAKPEYAREIRQLAENLDQFDFAPAAQSPKDYGKYMIRYSGRFEYDANLDEFYDFERYGQLRMAQEDGMFTIRGYISYHGTIPATQPETVQLRVAAYCRVSTDSDDQMNSFAAQNTHYNQMIQNHDLWELVDIYADSGITGTSAAKRQDFQRMLADCRKGKIDKILVKSISRFARNSMECLETIRELKSLGVSVFFEEHNIDTTMVSSEMLTAVIAACAQAESESISKNTRWGIQKKMARGEFVAPSVPFGFRKVNGELEIYDEEAEYVRYLFTAYLSGKSAVELRNEFIRRKAQEPILRSRQWSFPAIVKMLRNEKYIGDCCHQKTYMTDTFPRHQVRNKGEQQQFYVTNAHPAIIDRHTFDAVQKLLNDRSQHYAPNSNSPALIGVAVICGNCGAHFRRKCSSGQYVYACRTRLENVQACNVQQVREESLKEAFCRMYFNLKHHPEVLDSLLKNMISVRNRQMLWSPAVMELNNEISDILSQSHALSLLKKQGAVDSDVFISMSNQLAEQLRSAKQRKEQIQKQDDDETITQTQNLIETLDAGPEFLDIFDEELFCELIDKIIVDSNTKIRFRLKNGLELPESIERTVR